MTIRKLRVRRMGDSEGQKFENIHMVYPDSGITIEWIDFQGGELTITVDKPFRVELDENRIAEIVPEEEEQEITELEPEEQLEEMEGGSLAEYMVRHRPEELLI